ncbi:MAG: glycoside hydrolase family 32 protein [Thermoguttaceae bacterium]
MRHRIFWVPVVICLGSLLASPASAADPKPLSDRDILIADFEGESYGDWRVEGEAFGRRPAVANVSPGNRVTGHWGKGLVNSYLGGDAPVGRLVSPPLVIERPYINFLIGAGRYEGETCIRLVADGKPVRSAVGPALKNDNNEEVLDWYGWDVKDLAGRSATIEIVDNHSGGWGHINVDQVFQSDELRRSTDPVFVRAVSLDRTSLVPRYTFADSLQEQEKQLEDNPYLARLRKSREAMAGDPYRPIYHYVNPEGSLNDPNGLCFWQGRWHLFYQAYPPEDPRQHWGHAVSEDLVHWRDLPLAIYPNPEDRCYSGATLVEENRVIAMYHGTQVGNMVAVSSDPLLLNWQKVTGKAVIPIASADGSPLPYKVFDPCIWKKGDMYYSLSGGTVPGPGGRPVRADFLFRSADLARWEYLHPLVEDDAFGQVGDDGACPYFWPIGHRHILLHFSHMSGGKYILGNYDTARDKLVATAGGDFNFGAYGPCGVHAPSASPDGKGGVIVLFNMNPGLPTKGWNQIMSLPRRLTLLGDNQLGMEPAGDIESLRSDHARVEAMKLPANEDVVLEAVRGNAMELVARIDPQGAAMVEMDVLRSPGGEEATRILFFRERGLRDRSQAGPRPSVVTIDMSRSSTLPDATSRPPESGPVLLAPDEPVELRVFVDKSIVEVFVNGKQCVAVRAYPGRDDSLGVSLRAQGRDAELQSLDAWQMKSIWN